MQSPARWRGRARRPRRRAWWRGRRGGAGGRRRRRRGRCAATQRLRPASGDGQRDDEERGHVVGEVEADGGGEVAGLRTVTSARTRPMTAVERATSQALAPNSAGFQCRAPKRRAGRRSQIQRLAEAGGEALHEVAAEGELLGGGLDEEGGEGEGEPGGPGGERASAGPGRRPARRERRGEARRGGRRRRRRGRSGAGGSRRGRGGWRGRGAAGARAAAAVPRARPAKLAR